MAINFSKGHLEGEEGFNETTFPGLIAGKCSPPSLIFRDVKENEMGVEVGIELP